MNYISCLTTIETSEAAANSRTSGQGEAALGGFMNAELTYLKTFNISEDVSENFYFYILNIFIYNVNYMNIDM